MMEDATLADQQTMPSTEDGPGPDGRGVPLFVDLDGTLVATDLLWESVLELARTRPHHIWRLPLWLLEGRSNLKRRAAELIELEVETLPYRPEVLEYLRRRREEGRPIVLATASEERLARAVAGHLGLFDAVLASDGRINLKGTAKLEAIRGWCGPDGRFDYMGDSRADLPIWSAARRPILVGPGRRLLDRTRRLGVEGEVVDTPGGAARQALRAARPHQWAKNALLFVPLITAHRWFDWAALGRALVAFVAFSLAASSAYLLNDLLDLRFDRRHPSKRRRPLASGRLSITVAAVLSAGLLAGSLAISAALTPAFLGMVLLYLALTISYSLYLKRKLMVDVLCLAGLYTHRILAGGVATWIPISPWLLAFSMFLFLSLAFAKRYTELDVMQAGAGRVAGRGYRPGDLDMVRSLGPASGYLCIVIFCLYINNNDILSLYRRPWLLWMICPVYLYWISRVWFLAHRGELNHDPLVFALGDRISYMAGALVTLILMLAI
jgi:4-hydroxybenzoate polyprenyltransferase/phosphoserine phosphatase